MYCIILVWEESEYHIHLSYVKVDYTPHYEIFNNLSEDYMTLTSDKEFTDSIIIAAVVLSNVDVNNYIEII